MVAHFPYRWRHVDIIYRISRGILKHTKVVGTGLNPKPISGGMRKVVKRVRSGGNLKAISGDMGRVFYFDNHHRINPYVCRKEKIPFFQKRY